MRQTQRAVIADDSSFGLAVWRGEPLIMGGAHRHNDVELNCLAHGTVSYLFGGRRVALAAGDQCLFWAARPHQLIAGEGAPLMHWVTLPLGRFLSWRLPERLGALVLQGEPLVFAPPAASPEDQGQFARWGEDLAQGGAERQQIVCLELEALLRRLALQLGAGEQRGAGRAERRRGAAEQLADYIVANAQRPLSAAEIAASAGLHPHYAMQVFRQAYGLSLMSYLTQHRVAHAQQLLATTDHGVLEIGLAAGFGSASRFYSAFKAACGMSPGAYRASLQLPGR